VAILTATAFALLLEQLDADENKAAAKYEELRLKLVRCFVWRGCAVVNADKLADETLDRVAAKLAQTVEVQNINAYAVEVSRYVWLEFKRKHKEDGFGDELPIIADASEFPDEPDTRIACLKSCLSEITPDINDRLLILGYYDADENEKNKHHRKNLAEKLGLTMNTLKVKACRLRERLEKCINECVKK
jgi:DNA-directed RNA polymerase specialized sigma24 family protein